MSGKVLLFAMIVSTFFTGGKKDDDKIHTGPKVTPRLGETGDEEN